MAEQPRALSIPPLYCPFPTAMHPEADQLEEHILDWARSSGICRSTHETDRLRRSKLSYLAAAIYPHGPYELIKLIAELVVWYSQYDEAGFERPAASGNPARSADNMLICQRILEDPYEELEGLQPFHQAWQDLHRRLRQVASPTQVERFNIGVTRQILANSCEVVYGESGVVPSPQEYFTLRRGTSAVGHCYSVLLELAGGYELPCSTCFHPDLQKLKNLVSDIYGSCNDLQAYARESQLPRPAVMNLVAILTHHKGLTIPQAITQTAEIHRQQTIDFIRLAEKLRQHADQNLARFLTSLEYFISGHQHWYNLTPRYRETEEFEE